MSRVHEIVTIGVGSGYNVNIKLKTFHVHFFYLLAHKKMSSTEWEKGWHGSTQKNIDDGARKMDS